MYADGNEVIKLFVLYIFFKIIYRNNKLYSTARWSGVNISIGYYALLVRNTGAIMETRSKSL